MATKTVTFPVELGGTGTTYRNDTGTNGMAANNGYAYKDLLFDMFDEVVDVAGVVNTNAQAAATNAGTAVAQAGVAATQATAAAGSRSAIDNRIYPGTYASDPAVRPDGSSIQNGDIYINATVGAKQRIGGAWVVMTAAPSVDLANTTDDAKGAALVGVRGTTVSSALALPLRRPRKLIGKLFAAASAASHLRVLAFGDSLAAAKVQQVLALLDRRVGGTSRGGVNTAGTSAGAGQMTGGNDLVLSTNSGCTVETAQYQYWPTGSVLRMNAGASAAWIVGGATPRFTTVKVFFVKEPGAGTVDLVVGGVSRATSSADAAVDVGVLSYTQAYGQSTVSVTTTGAAVRVLFVHAVSEDRSGVDYYAALQLGGLLLANAMGSAQGRALFQAVMALVAPDVVSFEMDDNFGDGGSNDTALSRWLTVIDAACPYADKLLIASSPRASDDAGKRTSSYYLRGVAGARGADTLFFDGYTLMGSYAEMTAIFGADDGTHPTAAAQAYAAEVLLATLGLAAFNLGYQARAVNDPGLASTMGRGSNFQGPLSYLSFETDASFGYDWDLSFPRTLTLKTRGEAGSVNGVIGWQFSGNTAVAPHVIPLAADFNSAGNVRKWDVSTSSGYEFTRLRKTDNPGGGLQHLQVGLIRNSFTRAELLAIGANQVIGAAAFCSDCTGGAQWVYARGGSPTDWVTIDGKAAI